MSGNALSNKMEDHDLRHKILIEAGIALSNEKNHERLLEMILLEAKRLTKAEGGTLYLSTVDGSELSFEIMLNDVLGIAMGGTTGVSIPLPPLRLYDELNRPNHRNVASFAALSGKTISIADAYRIDDFDFSGTRAFDTRTGYHSTSFLTVPLKNHQASVIGVIQLINARDSSGTVIAFPDEIIPLIEALSSQAAVALENQILIESQSKLVKSLNEKISYFIKTEAELRVLKETAENAETRAKIEEKRFRDFASSSADIFWETDVSGNITFISGHENFIHINSSVKGIPFYDILLPLLIDRNDHNLNMIRSSIFDKSSFRHIEVSFYSLLRESRFLSFTGTPCFGQNAQYIGHRGTATDVTERRQSEFVLRAREKAEAAEAIAKSEQLRFQDFASSSADWFWESDKFGNIIYHSQPNSSDIESDILLSYLGDFFKNQNNSDTRINKVFWEHFLLLTTNHLPFRDAEFELVLSNGDRRFMTMSGVPAYDHGGDFFGYRGTTRDITARKDAEEALKQTNENLTKALTELQRTQAHLVHAEKMTALGQLVAGVAHEINNPLGFVIANLESLKELLNTVLDYHAGLENLINSNSLSARLNKIKDGLDIEFIINDIGDIVPASLAGLERIKDIIKHLRLFSRFEAGEPCYEDLASLIATNLELVKRQLSDKKIKIERNISELPKVKCFAGELNQVFMNLIVNAQQAMDEGGTLIIAGRDQGDGTVRIEFRDTGCGIPFDVIEKIFEPFFTTKPVGKGTGLGLSITYGIITNRHNGTIDVNSEVGKGTKFIITLPIDLPKSE